MRNKSLKYNLNLTRDYCSHWNVQHAVRELIANNIDEGGTLEHISNSEELDVKTLVLTTNKIMPIEAFLMGYSVKTGEHPIGQFGEGLKIAILILTREERSFEFYAGPYRYLFSFETPAGFGVPTLHVQQQEVPSRIDKTDTAILVHDVTKQFLDTVYTDIPSNSIFEGRGLYCQGLLVEPGFYLKIIKKDKDIYYGVNLNQPLNSNRDRNYYSNKELVVPVFEEYLTPEDFTNISTSWFSSYIYQGMSDEFAQKVCKAIVNQNRSVPLDLSKVRVILTNNWSTDIRYGSKPGYHIGEYFSYANNLWRNDDKAILDSLAMDISTKTLTDDSKVSSRKFALKRLYYLHKELSNSQNFTNMMESVAAYIPMDKYNRETLVKRLVDLGLHHLNGAELPEFDFVSTLESDDVDALALVVKDIKPKDEDEDEDDN